MICSWKHFFANNNLSCVLPLAVYLDLRHFLDTQGYLALLSVASCVVAKFSFTFMGFVFHGFLALDWDLASGLL